MYEFVCQCTSQPLYTFIILTYKHYYYTYLLTSSVKQIITVVDEIVGKLTNACCHEGGKLHL